MAGNVVKVLVLVCTLVGAQYTPSSPCPELFTYDGDGQSTYGTGTIRYRPAAMTSSLFLKANFSVKAILPTSYVGQLEVLGQKQAVLRSMLRGETLQYRVHFPISSPLPRLTALSANGNTICSDEPEYTGPGEAVTSITLSHMLYADRDGSGPVVFNAQNLAIQQNQPSFDTPNTNPTFFVNGRPVDANYNSFNLDSDEPSFSINTISVPYLANQKPAVTQQFNPGNSNVQFDNSNSNVQFENSNSNVHLGNSNNAQQNVLPQQFKPRPQPQLEPARKLACGVVSGGNDGVPLVYQGTSVSRGDWPWLTAIFRKKEGNNLAYTCTGSLVSNQHVITAAHCLHEKTSLLSRTHIVVKTGAYNLSNWSESIFREISEAYIHPNYQATTLENDILLLKLDSAVEFGNFVIPVCLWEGATDASFIAGQYGSVVGWGLNEHRGSGEGEPRMASVPIVTTETCRASRIEFFKLTSRNTICAGDRKGTGPCSGDSGGGLYVLWNGRWRLRGVVSVSLRPVTGEAKCNLNEYVVFTDVAQYLPWLEQHLSR